MTRSSNTEKAQRVNVALALIRKEDSVAKAAKALVSEYGISRSQAYRYVRHARLLGKQVPVPEIKIAFTVKLSKGLIQKVRQKATSTGKSISEIVTQALEAFLHKGRRGG